MINIPISLIKKLRDRTNIGILECKQALIHSNGNIQLAIDNMRRQGTIKVAKKSGKVTKAGSIFIEITRDKKRGIILELNCETDFVKNNDSFKKFGHTITSTALNNEIIDLNILQKHFQEKKNMLISIFDENINIKRMVYITGDIIGNYLHSNKKIGVIISISGEKPKEEKLLKHIAMHIAANKPEYIDNQCIPKEIIDHEKNIQMNIAMKTCKSYEIAQKITQGRINKFMNEISLINQPFIMNTKKTIINLLDENNIKIKNFIRFEVGEDYKNN